MTNQSTDGRVRLRTGPDKVCKRTLRHFEQRNFLPILRAKEDVPSRVAEKMVRDNPCAFYGI